MATLFCFDVCGYCSDFVHAIPTVDVFIYQTPWIRFRFYPFRQFSTTLMTGHIFPLFDGNGGCQIYILWLQYKGVSIGKLEIGTIEPL